MIRYVIAPIDVDVGRPDIVDFSVTLPGTVVMELADIVIGQDFPHYHGDMVIVPRVYAQDLETERTIVDSDIQILGIPAESVSNPQGGRTITIG